MKRALPELSTSAGAAKRHSALNNTNSFISDSIPPHHYQIGVENYAVVSVFEDVLNVHIQKFRTDEKGRISPKLSRILPQKGALSPPSAWIK
ncbi:hypothetical protein AVEN_258651-1 [Araneus ventricosus]|uniref:Uncharacterized protein n=1 Tax=Araneus ventricosus TaxID=182803 RepID=A0A4Y2JI35_ARAVE|nr:hypothetical protein AVEN_258651-1 [Araneus ventricosus]